MKTKFFWVLLASSLLMSNFAACGGGGGGVSVESSQPTAAVLTLSTSVIGSLPANTIITGYDVTVSLPAGVTVKSTNPPLTDDGVVVATGSAAGSSPLAVYTPAGGSTPAKVRVLVAKADGFNQGEFIRIYCDIAAGHNPGAADFAQPVFAVSGFNTSTNSNVDLTSQMTMAVAAVIQ